LVPVICKKAIQAIQNGKKVFPTKKIPHTINEAIPTQLASSADETAVKLADLEQAGTLNSLCYCSGMLG
jgi:hypothetical protein